ncbi:MAG: putative transcriptional regulator, Crp/Fnr family [Bacteroidetes bacterium]|nr:putative transcriptional regulator, Crp/Fnr family [Bacteroidota bacterium]
MNDGGVIELRTAIEPYISLSEEEWMLLSSRLEVKSLQKGSLLLHEGEVCRFLAFLRSGTVVYYYLNDRGEEVTTDFAFENQFVTDNRSRLSNSPSHLNIKAIEPVDLILLHEPDLNELYRLLPKMERVGRILIEQAYVRLVQLSLDLQILSAEERYLKLTREYPQALQRLPLYHIATYLGVAPKSLSRIRGKLS